MVPAFTPSTWEAEADRSLCVQGQPDTVSSFLHTQDNPKKQVQRGMTRWFFLDCLEVGSRPDARPCWAGQEH